MNHRVRSRRLSTPGVPLSRKTVRLVIIGNEVLSGKVADANTPWLLRRLRQIGAVCTGVDLVPDTIERIARAVRDAAEDAEVVFTSGGVGPTHDDVTMDGIAAAFAVGVSEHPDLVAALEAHIGAPLRGAQRRLARVPNGAVLENLGAYPQVRHGSVWIFPGIPALLRHKFEQIAALLAGERMPCTALYTGLRETELAAHLEATVAACPAAELGSYPRHGQDGWRVLVTVEGPDQACVDRAVAELSRRLGDALVRVEQGFHPEDEGGLGE